MVAREEAEDIQLPLHQVWIDVGDGLAGGSMNSHTAFHGVMADIVVGTGSTFKLIFLIDE